MNSRKLILVAVGLLVVCQLGWAQYGPTSAAQVRALAATAERTGTPLPLVPAAAPGHYRPFIWITAQVGSQKTLGPPALGLPGFCNVGKPGPPGFQFSPNPLRSTNQEKNIPHETGGA